MVETFWPGFGLLDIVEALFASKFILELLTSLFIMLGTLSMLFSFFLLSFERLLSRLGRFECVWDIIVWGGRGGEFFWAIIVLFKFRGGILCWRPDWLTLAKFSNPKWFKTVSWNFLYKISTNSGSVLSSLIFEASYRVSSFPIKSIRWSLVILLKPSL
jgi:hypothetical protein